MINTVTVHRQPEIIFLFFTFSNNCKLAALSAKSFFKYLSLVNFNTPYPLLYYKEV